jgi:hypothetical protein
LEILRDLNDKEYNDGGQPFSGILEKAVFICSETVNLYGNQKLN